MNFSPKSILEAKSIQLELQKKLRFDIDIHLSDIRTIASIDVSYHKESNNLIAGILLFRFPELTQIGEFVRVDEIKFPYVPGYLSFREGPTVIKLIQQEKIDVDVFLVDGHGIAHPRKLGIATFIGTILEKPTIGIAKKRLCGEFKEVGSQKGSSSLLRYHGEVVGFVYRSRDNVKPIFISPGFGVPLEKSLELVKATISKYRLPDPIRHVHQFVTHYKKQWLIDEV